MIYLTNFTNHTNYNLSKDNLNKPNISVCLEEKDVHYNPYVVDPYNGHDYVEIGGLKWATMNVGANSITDYGLYFQWGDTQGYATSQVGSGEGQKYFGWEDYKYGNGTSSPGTKGMTKYNSDDTKTVLDLSDDAARLNWGGSWRMATEADFNTLSAAIDFIDLGGTTISASNKLITLSGVTGILVADKNDHSKKLFFPAAGYCNNGSVNIVGSGGSYWTSSLNTSIVSYGRDLSFGSSGIYWQNNNYRCYGFPVRGVVD